MTKDEALKLALEALEELVEFVPLLRPTCTGDERAIGHRLDRANIAIFIAAEALAQPEDRNFCPRCGKRTADLAVIHTCTPPEGAQ